MIEKDQEGPEIKFIVRCRGCKYLKEEYECGDDDGSWAVYHRVKTNERIGDPYDHVGKKCPFADKVNSIIPISHVPITLK